MAFYIEGGFRSYTQHINSQSLNYFKFGFAEKLALVFVI